MTAEQDQQRNLEDFSFSAAEAAVIKRLYREWQVLIEDNTCLPTPPDLHRNHYHFALDQATNSHSVFIGELVFSDILTRLREHDLRVLQWLSEVIGGMPEDESWISITVGPNNIYSQSIFKYEEAVPDQPLFLSEILTTLLSDKGRAFHRKLLGLAAPKKEFLEGQLIPKINLQLEDSAKPWEKMTGGNLEKLRHILLQAQSGNVVHFPYVFDGVFEQIPQAEPLIAEEYPTKKGPFARFLRR